MRSRQRESEHKDPKKEHRVVSALAGKALPALQPVGDRLGKLFDFLSNKSDQLPEITVKQMEESKALLTQLETNFQAVMRKVSQNQSVCFDDVRAGFPSQAQVPPGERQGFADREEEC